VQGGPPEGRLLAEPQYQVLAKSVERVARMDMIAEVATVPCAPISDP
jgi:hypothetical protein